MEECWEQFLLFFYSQSHMYCHACMQEAKQSKQNLNQLNTPRVAAGFVDKNVKVECIEKMEI